MNPSMTQSITGLDPDMLSLLRQLVPKNGVGIVKIDKIDGVDIINYTPVDNVSINQPVITNKIQLQNILPQRQVNPVNQNLYISQLTTIPITINNSVIPNFVQQIMQDRQAPTSSNIHTNNNNNINDLQNNNQEFTKITYKKPDRSLSENRMLVNELEKLFTTRHIVSLDTELDKKSKETFFDYVLIACRELVCKNPSSKKLSVTEEGSFITLREALKNLTDSLELYLIFKEYIVSNKSQQGPFLLIKNLKSKLQKLLDLSKSLNTHTFSKPTTDNRQIKNISSNHNSNNNNNFQVTTVVQQNPRESQMQRNRNSNNTYKNSSIIQSYRSYEKPNYDGFYNKQVIEVIESKYSKKNGINDYNRMDNYAKQTFSDSLLLACEKLTRGVIGQNSGSQYSKILQLLKEPKNFFALVEKFCKSMMVGNVNFNYIVDQVAYKIKNILNSSLSVNTVPQPTFEFRSSNTNNNNNNMQLHSQHRNIPVIDLTRSNKKRNFSTMNNDNVTISGGKVDFQNDEVSLIPKPKRVKYNGHYQPVNHNNNYSHSVSNDKLNISRNSLSDILSKR